MTEYKLSYLNLRGRAELIRYLFALAGVKYEDHRIEFELQDWMTNKKAICASVNSPFGQIPVLSIDGVVFAQSVPIARYLAEKFGYAGKSDLEKLRADMIVHYCEDMQAILGTIFLENDKQKKAELTKQFETEDLKNFLANFEKNLKQNNGGDGFYVGDSVTWADLAVYHYVTSFVKSHAGIDVTPHLVSNPKLSALIQKVEKIPQISAWIAKRPVTSL